MDGTRPQCSPAGDRLSKLGDHALGNILSFLPAQEAARAALLSSRWRDVFGAVHTVSLEEPERPPHDDENDDTDGCCGMYRGPSPNLPPPFSSAVTNALLSRNRRGGAAPLRALRVAVRVLMEDRFVYDPFGGGAESTTVDAWVAYALQQAAPEGLRLDLRLCRVKFCDRPYSLRRSGGQDDDDDDQERCASHLRFLRPSWSAWASDSDDEEPRPRRSTPCDSEHGRDRSKSPRSWRSSRRPSREGPDCSPARALSSSADDDDDDDDSEQCHGGRYRPWRPKLHTVSAALFSTAALRSLSLGHCRLEPPKEVNLPSLETLLLSHVSDAGTHVEQIIAGCPRLADLTLEACRKVVSLRVPSAAARLRRLALRCCHKLATVVLDAPAPDLEAFEYRGDVPDSSFLTMHGASRSVAYCKVDICGHEVVSSEKLVKLRQFLELFVNARHLHLESARLGSGVHRDEFMGFATLPNLRHLELRGGLPDGDTALVDAVSRILRHAPSLRALSLVFHPLEYDQRVNPVVDIHINEEELVDTHRLRYSRHSDLAVPSSMIPCLRNRVREINLVHYQGGRAQRKLVKFLLCNAPVVEKLWCEFAEGPLWTQTQLMLEIKGWVMNESAKTQFF